MAKGVDDALFGPHHLMIMIIMMMVVVVMMMMMMLMMMILAKQDSALIHSMHSKWAKCFSNDRVWLG